MTAASGVVHEEFHSTRFAQQGGVLEMVQLWVNLPAADKLSPPRYQAIVDQTVESSFLKRYGTLDEQAAPIVFLASDEASYVTGSILPVAGGDLG